MIRVLVAGLGNMGRSHALAYHNDPAFQIVGLVNRSAVDLPEELQAYPVSPDFTEALHRLKPDLVCIATYSDSHADYAVAAMEAGADVFVEKPLFLIASFLYYLPMIGKNMLPRQTPASHRLASMSMMMVPEAVVGAVIYFSPVVLYSVFAEAHRAFGPDPKADQQLAGALMWALVMVIEAGWMMLIAVEWFTGEERKARKLDEEHSADIVVS
jgi:hypothetical protein